MVWLDTPISADAECASRAGFRVSCTAVFAPARACSCPPCRLLRLWRRYGEAGGLERGLEMGLVDRVASPEHGENRHRAEPYALAGVEEIRNVVLDEGPIDECHNDHHEHEEEGEAAPSEQRLAAAEPRRGAEPQPPGTPPASRRRRDGAAPAARSAITPGTDKRTARPLPRWHGCLR